MRGCGAHTGCIVDVDSASGGDSTIVASAVLVMIMMLLLLVMIGDGDDCCSVAAPFSITGYLGTASSVETRFIR